MFHRKLRRAGLVMLVLIVALMLPVVALAGGVAVIFDKPPDDAEAGKPLTIGFLIRSAHEDRTLMTGLKPLITASSLTTDEQVTATAEAKGDSGHYVASLTFPSAGEWQWQIQPFGKEDPAYSLALPGPVQVRAPGAKVAPAVAATRRQEVKALDAAFDARTLTVPAGTTITWVNMSKLPHTVKEANGTFASGNIDVNGSYSFTFAKAGAYAYYCEYHQGMGGTITVVAAPQTAGGAIAQPASVSVATEAGLPSTGGADTTSGAIILAAALLVAALGVALRWRSGRSAR